MTRPHPTLAPAEVLSDAQMLYRAQCTITVNRPITGTVLSLYQSLQIDYLEKFGRRNFAERCGDSAGSKGDFESVARGVWEDCERWVMGEVRRYFERMGAA